ncbi:nuclear transport factor 2 family protein [Variovorax paradoxus]|uniref:Uncharacterized protein n=1 Tax=Variovorax paradoxus TaxID=34073 RepID=A0A0H2MKC9_VARPD|nr:nuclear transport factor 2 family protein [Variovorax paradoxus]KLN57250.1 hypothetical protein VPARA_13300 [Variovorax paradoxus]
MQMQQAVKELFERYARHFNDALTAEPDLEAIADLYTDTFVAASPSGIMSGKNDDELRKVMADGFARYREMGTKKMEVSDLRVTPIDEIHGLAHVDWRATYHVDGALKVIDFTNVYLIRVDGTKGKVFGWITGDENAELKKHGIA